MPAGYRGAPIIWPIEAVDLLIVLWKREPVLSIGQIAELLGMGISNDAVSKKAARLGLPMRKAAVVNPWTDEVIARFRQLWDQLPELSSTEIGRRLGLSKNSILGKSRKLGLPPRGVPLKRKEANTLEQLAQEIAVAEPVSEFVAPPAVEHLPPSAPRMVQTAIDPDQPYIRRKVCCWPLWGSNERPTHKYCGEAVKRGHLFCEEHRERAHVPRTGATGGGIAYRV